MFPVLAICTTCLVVATTTSHCYTLHTLHTRSNNHTTTLCPKPKNTLPRCAINTKTHYPFEPQTHKHTITLYSKHTITLPLCAPNTQSHHHLVPETHNHTITLYPKHTNTLSLCTPNTQTHCHFVPQTHNHSTTLYPKDTITPLCAPNCQGLGSLMSERWSMLALFPFSRVYDQAFKLDNTSQEKET